MRAKYVYNVAAAKNFGDKYYANPELVKYAVNRCLQVIGKENITEIMEPAAGDGAFIKEIEATGIPGKFYDLTNETHNPKIIPQDFLTAVIMYKPGRLVLTGPPYGYGNDLWVKFAEKAADIADYVAFVSPASTYKQLNPIPTLELIDHKHFGMINFHGPKELGGKNQKVNTVFNIYKVIEYKNAEEDPLDEQLKKDFKIGSVVKRESRSPKIEMVKNKKYEYYICNAGWSTGKVFTTQALASMIGITVLNETKRKELEDFLINFRDNYIEEIRRRSTTSRLTLKPSFFKELLKKEFY